MSKDKITGLEKIEELLFGNVVYGNEKNPKKKQEKKINKQL